MKLNSDFVYEKYGLKTRLVNEQDAGFILRLRTNPKLNQFIHPTSSDINQQIDWIREYKKREAEGSEYYFIFYKNEQLLGCIRLYHIKENRFAVGSWLFEPDQPFEYAVASALITRTIAFDILGKELEYSVDGCHKDNKKVIKFNQMMGMKIRGSRHEEMGEFYLFNLTKKDFQKHKEKIEKLIGLN